MYLPPPTPREAAPGVGGRGVPSSPQPVKGTRLIAREGGPSAPPVMRSTTDIILDRLEVGLSCPLIRGAGHKHIYVITHIFTYL